MRLLVTGATGQVATALREQAVRGDGDLVVECAARPRYDLDDPVSLETILDGRAVDVLVSAAAYTAVDKAEGDRESAERINAEAPGMLSRAAARAGIPIVHLSTDYVFDGDGERPWTEDAVPSPRSVYGATKLRGEQAVVASNPRHVILRTAWVYSPFGTNFLRTMLRLASEREEIGVVADQWGNPTSACDLAEAIVSICRRLVENGVSAPSGIFHLTGEGSTTWCGFAEEIMVESREAGGPSARIRPIATSDYPTAAARPGNARLATERVREVFGVRLPPWQQSTRAVVRRCVAGLS